MAASFLKACLGAKLTGSWEQDSVTISEDSSEMMHDEKLAEKTSMFTWRILYHVSEPCKEGRTCKVALR